MARAPPMPLGTALPCEDEIHRARHAVGLVVAAVVLRMVDGVLARSSARFASALKGLRSFSDHPAIRLARCSTQESSSNRVETDFKKFKFHDLRNTALTEWARQGSPYTWR